MTHSVAEQQARRPLLSFVDVTVDFPGTRALDHASFAVQPGEVMGLMGENGAGKSTLLKVLAGALEPTAGEVEIGTQLAAFRSSADSIRAGIAVIQQELQLVPDMSVAENLLLGHWPSRHGIVDRTALVQSAARILADLGERIDPDTPLRELPIGQQQMVEIGKALLRDAQIIAFDEPTSSLSAREVEVLKAIIKRLRGEGRAIIYVTHRMEEVFSICDAVTVLRDGAVVARHPTVEGLTEARLVTEMIGRPASAVALDRDMVPGEPLLELTGVEGPGIATPIELVVRRGEIVGFFGLVGAGRTELMRLIAGAAPAARGNMRLAGLDYRPNCVADSVRAGVAMVPEDRKREAIFPLMNISENIAVRARRRPRPNLALIRRGEEAAIAQRFINELAIRTPSCETAIGSLSGGNQQKVVIARWLAENVEVLIADEPTRGVDVGARPGIYAALAGVADRGGAVLFVSSDLPEILSVCDRVVVMRNGSLSGMLDRREATPDRVLTLALPA